MILLIPTAILLAVSFFVLVTVAKVEAKSLKIFGWAVSIFLWIAAALILATAITTIAPCDCNNPCSITGSCPLRGERDWRTDPHHAWMNNPHSKSMLDNPHAGMMMDDMSMEDMPMGGMMGQGSDKQMKCPGMGNMGDMKDVPEKK